MAPAERLEVTRYQGDQNPDTATAQTIALMCQQIEKAARDPLLQRAARDAVQRFRGGPLYAAASVDPASNPCAIAESAYWWVKHALKFQLHNSLIQVWFNERDQLQLLISPDLLLRMSKPRGDCAIYSMLVCAMLRAWGIPYELVTAAVTPNDPEFDHVWARAVLPDGRRLNLDASHGKYPGWQVPFEHRNRTQVWDSRGNPIPDAAPRFRGLHAVPIQCSPWQSAYGTGCATSFSSIFLMPAKLLGLSMEGFFPAQALLVSIGSWGLLAYLLVRMKT